MKLSTAKRRINKTLDELCQSVVDDWYANFKNGYIKGYEDARQGKSPMYAEAYKTADTPQTEKSNSEYYLELADAVMRGEMSDAEANQAWYEYINKQDTPQTDCTGSPIGDYRDGVGAWQTDCPWK